MSLSSANCAAGAIKHVTVVGGGLMGSGIAQISATSGYNVTLVDVSDKVLVKSQASIKKNLERVAKKQLKDDEAAQKRFVDESLCRLDVSVNLPETASKTDLVIEAIVENMKVKHALFSSIDTVSLHLIVWLCSFSQNNR